ESLLDQLSLLPPPIEAGAVWDLLGAVPEEELLTLVEAMAAGDPLGVVEACRALLERGREPGAVLQGLAGLLRDLLLAGVAPDRLELTSVSLQLRDRLPDTARRVGRARLLHWQAQLRGGEQQLRLSVQPRLWLEVLLLGLLAEAVSGPARAPEPGPAAAVAPAPATAPAPAAAAAAAPVPAEVAAGGVPEPVPDLAALWQQILAGLELPSTRMLLSQQARLVRLDGRRAVVQVAATWLAMVQSRLPLLEKAVTAALGHPFQLVLEASGELRQVGLPGPLPGTPAPSARTAPPPAPAARPEPMPPAAETPSEVLQEQPPPPVAASPRTPAPPVPADGSPEAGAAVRSPLDEKARRLADFFNGEVIADLDDHVA
ncbi:MAG: DNA polymerase III subunit gamma/tau, partial [Synechococcaceae cyanobacterium]|nr:DNA polymerase III subunit gamma/tau [Synechococcaceae cyanobacterium]